MRNKQNSAPCEPLAETIFESITGSVFRGIAVRQARVGGFPAIIPQITGSAHVPGISQWMLDKNDPPVYGFPLICK